MEVLKGQISAFTFKPTLLRVGFFCCPPLYNHYMEELLLPKPKKPVDGSCFFCKFYVQPLNKANKPYDACCFNNKLNFKKNMSKECSLYGIDEHPERKLK